MPTKSDALYARYSSHQQDDSTSIEVQVEQCERAAGISLVRYVDRAKTGRTMGGRTELLRLIRDAEEGRIGRLFVYKFDRLGRAAECHVGTNGESSGFLQPRRNKLLRSGHWAQHAVQ